MKRTIIATAIGLFSFNALAASPSWNYVELGYVKADIDGAGDFDPDGFGVKGVKLLNENVYLTGTYSRISDDAYGFDIDIDMASMGLGYRYGLNATTDIFGEVTYEYVELSEGSVDEDENGYGLAVGVRSMVTNNIELSGAIRYIDIDDEDDTEFEVGANYYFTPNFALGASYALADDVDFLSVVARYSF